MSFTSIPIGFVPSDDVRANEGRNGRPAFASALRRAAIALNAIQFGGRSIYHWWGGDDTTDEEALLRLIYMCQNGTTAQARLRASALMLRGQGAVAAGQGIRLTADAVDYDAMIGDTGLEVVPTLVDPTNLASIDFGHGADGLNDGLPIPVEIGSLTSNGPGLVAGMLYEPATSTIDMDDAGDGMVPTDWIAQSQPIAALGTTGSVRHISQIIDRFLKTWNYHRPVMQWSCKAPGTNYVDFPYADGYKYLHAKRIGSATGCTAPAVTGPAWTFPLDDVASGRNATIKCALYIYARLYGAVGSETANDLVAISHRAANGTDMTAFSTGTNPPTIDSADGWRWWPALGDTPWTFDLRADLPFERIVLGAKGITDGAEIPTLFNLQVGAYALVPRHSTTIE